MMMDRDTEHWGDDDLDSVMMYGADCAQAVKNVGLNHSQGKAVISSGIHLQCDVLSHQDVAALKFMYPPLRSGRPGILR